MSFTTRKYVYDGFVQETANFSKVMLGAVSLRELELESIAVFCQ